MNDHYSDLLAADDIWDEADWYEEFDDDDESLEFGDDLDDFEDEVDVDVDFEAIEFADAMESVFGALTAAESFNIGKALGQIGKGASQVISDPTVRQIAATAAPVAGGALGSVVAGPGVGTVVGTSLGTAAGKALAPTSKPAPVPVAAPAAAPGSAAATKALVSTQLPDVLKALCALAAGAAPTTSTTSTTGIPAGALMSMVAKQFERAAEDADELLYAADSLGGEASPRERADALYAALIDRENAYLAEAGLA